MADPAVYRFGAFELRPADYALLQDGRRVKLSPKAFDVLRVLVERHGRLVEKEALLRSVWPDTFVEDANLSVQIAAIRRALGEPPNGGEYIETVPKRGYKFIALPQQGAREPYAEVGSAGARSRHAQPRARIVVLPLTILRSDSETDFLSFSIPDAIATALSDSPLLQVRSPLASPGASARDDPAALAATTGGTHALAGTLVRLRGEIRVGLQLLALPDATVQWSESMTASLDTLFEFERAVPRRVSRALAAAVADGGTRARTAVPHSGAAYALYLRANQLAYEASQWAHARELYRECLDADPAYAPAWAGLARCERVLGKFSASEDEGCARLEEAERSFERALTLDPDLSIAHNLYAQLEVDLGRAPVAMRRLIALSHRRPVDPQPYAGLVHALRFCGLLDESLAAHSRARELDAAVPTSVHHTWWMRGEYERALSETHGDIGYMPGLALAALGREQEAITALRWRERETQASVLRFLLVSLRALLEGGREESLGAIAAAARSPLDGEARFYLGRSCARLGEPKQALDLLERAVAGGFACHQTFVRDPWLAPLAGTARFESLIVHAREISDDARRAFMATGGPALLA